MLTTFRKIVRATGLRRAHVAAVRMCCERHVLASFPRRNPRSFGRVLCYHSIGQPEFGVNDVTPAQLRRHLELALDAGYRFVPASSLAGSPGDTRDLAITFDDGLRSVQSNALPILKEFGVPWSLFVVSDWANDQKRLGDGKALTWRDIEALAAAGAEIGSHSVTHPDFSRLSAQQAMDELAESRAAIEKNLGIETTSFAIPLGQSMNWTEAARKAAREVGYTTIYAQAEETRPEGTIARTFITRFDTERVFRAALSGAFDRWEEWV